MVMYKQEKSNTFKSKKIAEFWHDLWLLEDKSLASHLS